MDKDKLCYCTLHALERLVEAILINTCLINDARKTWLTELFAKLNKSKGKALARKHKVPYIPKKGQHGGPITLDFFNKKKYHEEAYGNEGLMLPWKHCLLILQTFNFWFPEMQEVFGTGTTFRPFYLVL